MVRAGARENPFRPGAGQMPPLLAGRDGELASAEQRLRQLAGGTAPPQGFLLYGPRGNGKTVLAERIAERARELGMRAERLPAAALRREERLVRSLQERARLLEGRLTGMQLGPLGAAAERAPPTGEVSRLFAAWVLVESPPLVVVLDEVQTAAPEVGRMFFEAVQNSVADQLPFWVVAAGTPDAPRRIRGAGTFAERAFERFPIGRLDAAAAAAALAKPAAAGGCRIAEDALDFLVEKSQRYPYFVQLFGSAVWEAAARNDEAGVGPRVAEAAAASAAAAVERFYQERFDEAREREVAEALAPLADRILRRGGRLGDGELMPLLREIAARKSVPLDWVSLLARLRDLGVVWETSSAVWEMGIPSFADYLLLRTRGSAARPNTLR